MIRSARFRNYRSLREVNLTFEPFTVLVGPNSSGKTSVLRALHQLSSTGLQPPSQVFSGLNSIQHIRSQGQDGDVVISVAVENGPRTGQLALVLSRETFRLTGSSDDWACDREGLLSNPSNPAVLSNQELGFRSFLEQDGRFIWEFFSSVFLRLDPDRLAEPSYSNERVPRLGSDGRGLASVLAYLALTDSDAFSRLQEGMRSVIPTLSRVRLERAEVGLPPSGQRVWGNVVELELLGARNTPSHAASEGTMLAIGFFTALMSDSQPRVVLLDDLDRGLHPKAIMDLVQVIRRTLNRNPGLQVIATTHSPYLIDQMSPEEVRLTSTLADGSVVVGKLTDHPEFERWKQTMLPGEFWSMVGEKWLTQAREHADANS